MNQNINDVLKRSDGRYLTKEEGQVLRDFSRGLEGRLAAMEEVALKEGRIVERAVKELMRAYPDYKEKYPEGQLKATRDMSFILRYASHSMVREDPRYFEDTVLAWLGTILRGVGLRSNLIADGYRAIDRFAAEELSAPTYQLIKPFISMATAALSAPAAPPQVAAVAAAPRG
jgi:hypothetical protein